MTEAEEIRELARAEMARRSLLVFCGRIDDRYQETRHTDLVIEHLEKLEKREITKLIVEMPPRHSKSYHVSERFPAWYLGRHPDQPIIVSSYGAQLAERQSRRIRNLIDSSRYPFDATLSKKTSAANLWELEQGAEVAAAGVGGALTGFGASLLIIDDPLKGREEAESENQRAKVWEWYTDVAKTRLMPEAIELICMTRWHEDDLVGRILASDEADEWTVLRLPALAEDDDPLGREEGDALWPDWYDVNYLENMKTLLGTRSFTSLFQQRPTQEEGGTFKREWLSHRYGVTPPERAAQLGLGFDSPWYVCMSVDSSWDEGVSHDYSSIAVWATDLQNRYLLYQWRKRVEYPDLKRAILDIYGRQSYKPFGVFVEDAANGRPLIQELKRLPIPVVGVKPVGSKESRAAAVTPWFESGSVLLPERADWLEDWIDEHLMFPNGQYDDQVDTTSLGLKQLVSRFNSRELAMGFGQDIHRPSGMSERRSRVLSEKLNRHHGVSQVR